MEATGALVTRLNAQAASQSALERLQALRAALPGPVVFTTSLSPCQTPVE